jgi:CRISPR-associated protein Cas1
MAFELLNVLYVQQQGAMLHLEHDTVRVEVDRETRLRIPILRLSGIVVFGRVLISPFLIHRCAQDGRNLVWLDERGRYQARVDGSVRGNVLLRRAQHLALCDRERTVTLARQIVAGKLQNSRQVLLRAGRNTTAEARRASLTRAATRLADGLTRLPDTNDLDSIRGIEGDAARTYFSAFRCMLNAEGEAFAFAERSRRPPRDRGNAVLSFLYALVRAECASALEGVGLDPQVGYLHTLRPGRPALALDLMEELRAVIADRLLLTLANRRQLRPEHLRDLPGGAVNLTDEGRKLVITAYQKRKEETMQHPLLRRKVPVGLLPHLQARLLARHLRGDLAVYPPFIHR